MKQDYTNQKVAILGYGIDTKELVPLLLERQAKITICDKNIDLSQDIQDVEYRLGEDYLADLNGFDYLFRTPALPYLTPELQEAAKNGAILTSQTQLFLEECPARVIGVTGTKGKGTTASLIEAMINVAHKNNEIDGQAFIAGNIGISMIPLLAKIKPEDWAVLELSSFQLHGLTVSPHVAVVLRVTQDHLDHHATVDEYVAAKHHITLSQTSDDYIIVNHDEPGSMSFLDVTKAQPLLYSGEKPVEVGAFATEKQVILRMPNKPEEIVCEQGEINMVGRHNLENIAAASIAASLAGASLKSIHTGAVEFKGLPHHTQLVATNNTIRYYDDSFSTNPVSTIAAIRSFNDPITLILGGSSKGADFTGLVEALRGSCVTDIVLIGVEGERLIGILTAANGPWRLHDGVAKMPEIVSLATSVTKPCGVVLLSPACASFGLFKDYKDRGDQFTAATQRLE